MLYPCTGSGEGSVARLGPLRQRLVLCTFGLNPVDESLRFKPLAVHGAGVSAISKHLGAGVVWVDQVLEVLAVVHAGGVGLEGADEFVPAVDVDRQFVAKVALAVLLGPTRFSVFMPALGRVPVCWGGLLLDDLFFLLRDVLFGCGNQGGVDNLPTSCNKSLAQQLSRHGIEQGLSTRTAYPVLKGPDGGAIGYVAYVAQPTESLVAHAVKQLEFHLLIGQVVQPLEHQDANHGLGGKRRSSTQWGFGSRGDSINLGRQGRELNVGLNALQGVTQGFNLSLMRFVSKQIVLEGRFLGLGVLDH